MVEETKVPPHANFHKNDPTKVRPSPYPAWANFIPAPSPDESKKEALREETKAVTKIARGTAVASRASAISQVSNEEAQELVDGDEAKIDEVIDLEALNYKELQALAKDNNIRSVGVKKQALIDALEKG